MRDAVIVALHFDPDTPTPHGVDAVQPFDRRFEGKAQSSDGVVGINRDGVAAIGMRVERAYHGFHGGIVECGHVGVPIGSAAMIVASQAGVASGPPVYAIAMCTVAGADPSPIHA